MSHFSSNLSRPPRSRVPRRSGAVSDGQLVSSSYSSPVVVPTLEAVVNPLPNVEGSRIPAHGVHEDPTTSVEPFKSTP